jgi:hypothetical protein
MGMRRTTLSAFPNRLRLLIGAGPDGCAILPARTSSHPSVPMGTIGREDNSLAAKPAADAGAVHRE